MTDATISTHGKEQTDITNGATEATASVEIPAKAVAQASVASNVTVPDAETATPSATATSFTAAISGNNEAPQPTVIVPPPVASTTTAIPAATPVPAIPTGPVTVPIGNPVLPVALPTLNLTLPLKTRKDSSSPANDPWTYAQLNLEDVVLKPRSADQPSDSRDFVVGNIKGVDVSSLKYNDLRKICVRLRLPNYKNQNKDGMLQLITIAKMKEQGILPDDFVGEYLPMGTGVDSRMHGMRPVGPGMTPPSGMLHDFANNAAMSMNGKRKRQDHLSMNPSAMKKMDSTSSKLEDAALLSAAKLDAAKLRSVNYDLFAKVSDRIRALRKELASETIENSKKELEEEIAKLQSKKAELRSQI